MGAELGFLGMFAAFFFSLAVGAGLGVGEDLKTLGSNRLTAVLAEARRTPIVVILRVTKSEANMMTVLTLQSVDGRLGELLNECRRRLVFSTQHAKLLQLGRHLYFVTDIRVMTCGAMQRKLFHRLVGSCVGWAAQT